MATSGYRGARGLLRRRQRLEAGLRGLELNVSVRDGGLDGFAQLLVRLVIRKSFVNGEDGHFEGADGVGREHGTLVGVGVRVRVRVRVGIRVRVRIRVRVTARARVRVRAWVRVRVRVRARVRVGGRVRISK